MPNTPNYGIPYPAGSDQIEGTFIQRVAESADTLVNRTGQLTSKGDLFTRSTASTRLAVGPDGSYLVSAGTSVATGMSWNGSFSGTFDSAMELIATATAGTAGATLSFTSIPSTYSMLVLRGKYQTGSGANLAVTFNSNGGSVYKTAYILYNNAVQGVFINSGTFANGTATAWVIGQPFTPPGQAAETTGNFSTRIGSRAPAFSRRRNEDALVEMYLPEYTTTSGTVRVGYAESYRSDFTMRPSHYGRNATRAYLRFSENIFESDLDHGNPLSVMVFGTGQNTIDTAGTSVTLRTTVPLDNGGAGGNDWYNSDGAQNATVTRSATGGTTSINLTVSKRPGLVVGDTFIIANYTGTALGINGTWTMSSGTGTGTGTGTSIITYISGVAGTIVSENFSQYAELRMLRSGYYTFGTLTTAIGDTTAPATAIVSIGGTRNSLLAVSSVRYTETGTAISSITINNSVNSVFKLYGVK